MKFLPVEDELFVADRRIERTEMRTIIVTLRRFGKASEVLEPFKL
jgi:hypothetical protein